MTACGARTFVAPVRYHDRLFCQDLQVGWTATQADISLITGGRWNWFETLSGEAAAAVARCCNRVELPARQNIYRRGEPAKALYQVVSGRVQMKTFSGDGRELLYVHMQAGDCFGELGLIDGQPYHHDADTGTATTLLRLGASDFRRLRQAFPEIDRQLLLLLARRNRTVYDIFDDALLLDLPHRLARRLWGLFDDPVTSATAPEIVCSHEDLARMIGSSRQSVSATLKDWERKGWLKQAYGRIRLLDPQGLAKLLEG